VNFARHGVESRVLETMRCLPTGYAVSRSL